MEQGPQTSAGTPGAPRVTVALDKLFEGLEFASFGGYVASAYICKETGRIYVVSSDLDIDEDPPPDIEQSDQYLALPSKRDLRLGRDLAIAFVMEHLPSDLDAAYDCFRRCGAYARFKSLLLRRGQLDAWHRFEEDATVLALRDWCDEHGFELCEDRP
jgi:hypothetical protein